uniref:Uncharacterized protein n=1 Tax=viral metagenome TaxID=1070528 RepID=A0A6C0LAR5_9ZZZZ
MNNCVDIFCVFHGIYGIRYIIKYSIIFLLYKGIIFKNIYK